MHFIFALRHVKKGKKIKREGWNGKDQYVTLAINFPYLDKSSDCIVNPEHKDIALQLSVPWYKWRTSRMGGDTERPVS